MSNLADRESRFNVKLMKARDRFSRHERPEPLRGSDQVTTYKLRCLFVGCGWEAGPLQSEDAAITVGQLHRDSTGHPVRVRCFAEWDGPIIRATHLAERE